MSYNSYDDRMEPVEDLPSLWSMFNSEGLSDLMGVAASFLTGVPGAIRPGQLGFTVDTAASAGMEDLLNMGGMYETFSAARKQDAIKTARKWSAILERMGWDLSESDQMTLLTVAEKVQFIPVAKVKELLKTQLGLPDMVVNALCSLLEPEGGRRLDAMLQMSSGAHYQFRAQDYDIASSYLNSSFDEYGRNEQGIKMSDAAEGIGAAMRSGRLRTYAHAQNINEFRANAAAEAPASGASPTAAMSMAAERSVRAQHGQQYADITRPLSGTQLRAKFSEEERKTFDAVLEEREFLTKGFPSERFFDTGETAGVFTGDTDKLGELQATYREQQAILADTSTAVEARQKAQEASNKAITDARDLRWTAMTKQWDTMERARSKAQQTYFEEQGYTGEDATVAQAMLRVNEQLAEAQIDARWLYVDDTLEPMKAIYNAARQENDTLVKIREEDTAADLLTRLQADSANDEYSQLGISLYNASSEFTDGYAGRFSTTSRGAIRKATLDKIERYQQVLQQIATTKDATERANLIQERDTLEKQQDIQAYRQSISSTAAHRDIQETLNLQTAVMKTGRRLQGWEELTKEAGGEGMLSESLVRKFTANARSFDAPTTTASVGRIGELAVRMNLNARMLEPVAAASATIASQRGLSAASTTGLMESSLLYASSYLANALPGNKLDTATAVNMGVKAVEEAAQTQAYKNAIALGTATGLQSGSMAAQIQEKLKKGEALTEEEQNWLANPENVRAAFRTAGYDDFSMMALFDARRLDEFRVSNPEAASNIQQGALGTGDQSLWQFHENQMSAELAAYMSDTDARTASDLYMRMLSETGDRSTALAIVKSEMSDTDVATLLKSKGMSDDKIRAVIADRKKYQTGKNPSDLRSMDAALTQSSSRTAPLEGRMKSSAEQLTLQQVEAAANQKITSMNWGTTSLAERVATKDTSMGEMLTAILREGVTTVDGTKLNAEQVAGTMLYTAMSKSESAQEMQKVLGIDSENAAEWEQSLLDMAKTAGIDTNKYGNLNELLADDAAKAKLEKYIMDTSSDAESAKDAFGNITIAENRTIDEFKRKAEQPVVAESTEEPATTNGAEASAVTVEATSYSSSANPVSEERSTSSESREPAADEPVASQSVTATATTARVSPDALQDCFQQLVDLISELKSHLEDGKLKVHSTISEG